MDERSGVQCAMTPEPCHDRGSVGFLAITLPIPCLDENTWAKSTPPTVTRLFNQFLLVRLHVSGLPSQSIEVERRPDKGKPSMTHIRKPSQNTDLQANHLFVGEEAAVVH